MSSERDRRAASWLQVWVEAGQEGQVFTYANPQGLELGCGDLVHLRLRGRPHVGLVVELLDAAPTALEGRALQPIDGLHQRAAVDASWQQLIEAVASDCRTSVFRTLKAALPPGWLGQRRQGKALNQRQQIWLALSSDGRDHTGDGLPAGQVQLLSLLQSCGGEGWQSAVLAKAGVGRSCADGLEKRGLLQRERRPFDRHAPAAADLLEPPQQLTADQARALEAIEAAPNGGTLLLWGVTGAGKTEVYLQAAASHLQAGRSVLLLTPEIGLIPQLLDRCRQRFGPQVVEYHSGCSDGQRIAGWRRCLAGEAGDPVLVVGTRSAVFLPLPNLGLVVLDEEHDRSYKQDSPMPCYHARDVAAQRAQLSGARLLLGSATPSLETWLSCQGPQPSCQLLSLPQRIGGRALPPVHVVDMRQELAEGHRRLVSRPLMERLEALPGSGGQAVVLVPRRGYSSFLSCRSCGEVVQCPHCDVALTVHRQRERSWLRCHWCDHRAEISHRCGACGSTAFKPFGAGTQQVLEHLEQELEGLRLLRFDRDTTRGRDGHRLLLDRFAAGEADVLVGTQMLAKGMDLPQVTLAAVLAADGLLHRPDLRAAEECLQLLLQLAGRAGRGDRPGEVLVQTYSPEHRVIRHLVDGRYEAFLAEELAERRAASLVPFSRACLLRLSGPSASRTATAAAALAERIRGAADQAGWMLIGPAPAPVARVAGNSRWQLLLHGPLHTGLPLPVDTELRALLPRDVSLAIDPDPLEL
ncbi:MAG: primosomal protein N' [Cyanobacteria bacterium M_surface_10_m2_179]|nr:primosomal protein N' [Cyanobacteria bacterium M_surface_10_m2_179]